MEWLSLTAPFIYSLIHAALLQAKSDLLLCQASQSNLHSSRYFFKY